MDVPRASGKIVPELGTVRSIVVRRTEQHKISGKWHDNPGIGVRPLIKIEFDIVRDIEIIVRFIKTTIYSLYK